MNIFFALTIFLSAFVSCSSNNSIDNKAQPVAFAETAQRDSIVIQDTTKNYFPFELNDIEGHYQIVAQIEGPRLYPKYYDFFKKYGYEGNGYCWQGHITQILEKLDKELLKHIDFDPEGGGFFATADSKANQLKFVALLSPIFADLKKLEEWVKKADRKRIDD